VTSQRLKSRSFGKTINQSVSGFFKSYLTRTFSAPIGRALNELLVIHALRPDRLLASAHLFISSTFGGEFMQQDKVLDVSIIQIEIKCENF
jgi:hypothetical protein